MTEVMTGVIEGRIYYRMEWDGKVLIEWNRGDKCIWNGMEW